MQKNEEPEMPSACSAFSRPRPRRRVRRNIEPSPDLCRRLVFDDSHNNNVTGNEIDVTTGFNQVALEEQAGFTDKWRNNRAEIERKNSFSAENLTSSDWVPIPMSVDRTPSVLRRFQNTELKIERPESPVPFLKKPPPAVESNQDSSTSSSANALPLVLPSISVSVASASVIDRESICLLPRSSSDIPIRSLNLTPPLSPRSKDDAMLRSLPERQQSKLTGEV